METSNESARMIPRKIELNSREYLGIPTGIAGKSFSLTKLYGMKSDPGYIVRGDSYEVWKIGSFCKQADEVFLYGPYAEGICLDDALAMPIDEFLPLCYRLVSAFMLLLDNNISIPGISTHSVFFLKDNGVLILPPAIMKELMDLQLLSDKLKYFEICNHPDRKGETNLSFSIAVLLYRVLAGKYPFIADNPEELHHMIRDLEPPSPRLVMPDIQDRFAELISLSFSREEKKVPLLKTWAEAIRTWQTEGIHKDLTEDEKTQALKSAEEKKQREENGFRLKRFFMQNGTRIGFIALIVLAVGLVAGFSIYNLFFAPRKTKGFTPLEVVRAYYESTNTLDYQMIDDAAIKDVGKSVVQVVMNLFIITRQINAYDQTAHFLSAKEWDEKGREKLDTYIPMYGVIKLAIEQDQPEPNPVFVASYERWNTDVTDDAVEPGKVPVVLHGVYIKERLFLKKDKNDWVIYKNDVLTEQVIE